MSLDERLEGWDGALFALIDQLEAYKRTLTVKEPGWDDAINVARKLIGDARTQKGLLAGLGKEPR